MKAETLADELEALIETIGGAGGLLVKNKAMIELAKSAPDLLSALRRVEKPVFAWVIEAPGQHYLAAREIGGLTSFHWTTDHEKALRFWSREQADLTASGVRRLEPALWAFAGTLGEAWPREHGWIARQALTGEGQ